MKNHNIICEIIVTFVMLVVAVISLFYLPSEIAVQWNENGVSGTAGKSLILIFPVLNVVFTALHRQKEYKGKFNFNLLVSLILFTAQCVIILNELGHIDMLSPDYGFIQRLALLIIGLTVSVCGNHIPKFAKNYYCGVKSSFSFSNNDLWTKTQRFSGKVWFISGLVIMLLSFIQCKSSGFLAAGIVLIMIVIPRSYSTLQYKKYNAKN